MHGNVLSALRGRLCKSLTPRDHSRPCGSVYVHMQILCQRLYVFQQLCICEEYQVSRAFIEEQLLLHVYVFVFSCLLQYLLEQRPV